MSVSNAKRRRIKPFARPTAFDCNVVYDIRHQQIKFENNQPLFSAVELMRPSVLEGEILIKKAPDRAAMPTTNACFSFANGLRLMVPLKRRQESHQAKNP